MSTSKKQDASRGSLLVPLSALATGLLMGSLTGCGVTPERIEGWARDGDTTRFATLLLNAPAARDNDYARYEAHVRLATRAILAHRLTASYPRLEELLAWGGPAGAAVLDELSRRDSLLLRPSALFIFLSKTTAADSAVAATLAARTPEQAHRAWFLQTYGSPRDPEDYEEAARSARRHALVPGRRSWFGEKARRFAAHAHVSRELKQNRDEMAQIEARLRRILATGSGERPPGVTRQRCQILAHERGPLYSARVGWAGTTHALIAAVSTLEPGTVVELPLRPLDPLMATVQGPYGPQQIRVPVYAEVSEERMAAWEQEEREVAELRWQAQAIHEEDLALEQQLLRLPSLREDRLR